MFGIDLFFVPIRIVDLIEIALLTILLYRLYRLMRGTIAIQILGGLILIFLIQTLFSALDMRVFTRLFRIVGEVLVLGIIILFQPEIRRLLTLVIGQNPLIRRIMQTTESLDSVTQEVVKAVVEMSRKRTGALIAIARTTGLRTYVETGTPLHSTVSLELLLSIFFPKSALHDGAAIIQDGRLEAARCILPISQSRTLNADLGLRHRAALGLSEQTDAIIIVVSEERGTISIAEGGELTLDLNETELRQRLQKAMNEPERAQPAPVPA